MDLTSKKCVPCEGGVLPLIGKELARYMSELKTSWELFNNKKIKKEFKFKDFKEAMVFVNEVAGIANAEDHHPDVSVHYNRVVIELWTHAIGGLSENDFIVAAKVEALK